MLLNLSKCVFFALSNRCAAKILEHIDQTGSMNQTAKLMKMSYKAVWSKIKTTEKHMNACIVYTDRKAGSRLSQDGKELLNKYKLLKAKCVSTLKKQPGRKDFQRGIMSSDENGQLMQLFSATSRQILLEGLGRITDIKFNPYNYNIVFPDIYYGIIYHKRINLTDIGSYVTDGSPSKVYIE